MERTKPFLKWAGGKFKLVDLITSFMPEHPARYIEPFVGAGAVALNVPFSTIIVNDTNEELVNVWTMLRNQPEDVIRECEYLFRRYNHEDDYYALRAEFNRHPANDVRRAALFIYLNKHGFNGLCRFNRKGEFNVPYGRYKTVAFDADALRGVSKRMQGWLVTNQDFGFIMSMAREGDVVYCDPPYVSDEQVKAGFTAYSKEPFSLEEQSRLARLAQSAASQGVTVIISNHDTEFTRKLYLASGAQLFFVSVQRNISCKGDKRHKASELVAVFTPKKKKSYSPFDDSPEYHESFA